MSKSYFGKIWSLLRYMLIREKDVNDKVLIEMAEFVEGKTIKEVEWWRGRNNYLPTFVFTDDTQLELYLIGRYGFGWVLNDPNRPERVKGKGSNLRTKP